MLASHSLNGKIVQMLAFTLSSAWVFSFEGSVSISHYLTFSCFLIADGWVGLQPFLVYNSLPDCTLCVSFEIKVGAAIHSGG